MAMPFFLSVALSFRSFVLCLSEKCGKHVENHRFDANYVLMLIKLFFILINIFDANQSVLTLLPRHGCLQTSDRGTFPKIDSQELHISKSYSPVELDFRSLALDSVRWQCHAHDSRPCLANLHTEQGQRSSLGRLVGMRQCVVSLQGRSDGWDHEAQPHPDKAVQHEQVPQLT